MHAGIVGAGLVGRLLALALVQKGWRVSLFEKDNWEGQQSCGWMAAGMISPYAESVMTEPLIWQLGIESLQRWPEILASLSQKVDAKFCGSLVVAHHQDAADMRRFKETLINKLGTTSALIYQQLDYHSLLEIESELANNFQQALLLMAEGHITSSELWPALFNTLKSLGVTWYANSFVNNITQSHIEISDKKNYEFDQVFDCRGFGAKENIAGLRGVRGELLWLYAPEVSLSYPVRLLHPRYALYIVPQPQHVYIVGATMIESEDMGAISVQSTLELLSAAYSVHKSFAEAKIIRTLVNCRPAFNDNLPRIINDKGLLRINGFYRHGYLLAPAIIAEVMRWLDGGVEMMENKELYYVENK